VRISEKVIKHIFKRHMDWIKMLGLSSEVKNFLVQVLSRPDEVYRDKVRSDVKYFLRRLNNKFLRIVIVGDEVVTAHFKIRKNTLNIGLGVIGNSGRIFT
jgi:DNA gyrase inhibitor GyrI